MDSGINIIYTYIKTINLIYSVKSINFVLNKKINAMKNQKIYLEHANITVNDLTNAIRFFQAAFPHFEIRGEGIYNGRKWVHLGDQDTYLALNQVHGEINIKKDYQKTGINHIGFVVEDVNAIADRLLEQGFERDFPRQEEEFRIREYFTDKDGNEYEFVQYLSTIPEEKNLYA